MEIPTRSVGQAMLHPPESSGGGYLEIFAASRDL